MEIKKITVCGNIVSYVDNDTNLDTSLLFLHGNSLSAKTWEKQFEDHELTSKYRLIAINFPGYGSSPKSKNPEKDYLGSGFKNTLIHFYKELHLKKIVFVGHSLGGNILLQSVPEIPQTIAIALIASPPIGKPMNPEMYNPHPAVPHFFLESLTDDAIKLIAESLFVPGTYVPAEFLQMIENTDPLTRKYIMQEIITGDYTDEVKLLEDTPIPVAIFHGKFDQLVNLHYLEHLTIQTLWKQKIQVIENAGHMMQYENADNFNQKLLEFLNYHNF